MRGPNGRVQNRHGQDEHRDDRLEEEVLRTEEEATDLQRIEAEISVRACFPGCQSRSEEILRRWFQHGNSDAQKLFRRGFHVRMKLCRSSKDIEERGVPSRFAETTIRGRNENITVYFAEFLCVGVFLFHNPRCLFFCTFQNVCQYLQSHAEAISR